MADRAAAVHRETPKAPIVVDTEALWAYVDSHSHSSGCRFVTFNRPPSQYAMHHGGDLAAVASVGTARHQMLLRNQSPERQASLNSIRNLLEEPNSRRFWATKVATLARVIQSARLLQYQTGLRDPRRGLRPLDWRRY